MKIVHLILILLYCTLLYCLLVELIIAFLLWIRQRSKKLAVCELVVDPIINVYKG